MANIESNLTTVCDLYGLGKSFYCAKRTISNWHGDICYRIESGDKNYIVRFVKEGRPYRSLPLLILDKDILEEQIRFWDFLHSQGIPVSRRILPKNQVPWVRLDCGSTRFHILAFEWIEGSVLTSSNPLIAQRMGRLARRLHDVAAGFPVRALPERDIVQLAEIRMDRIAQASTVSLHGEAADAVAHYLRAARVFLEQARKRNTDCASLVVHGDLAPTNVISDAQGEIAGVIDFDKVCVSDRASEIAQLLKWYGTTPNLQGSSSENYVEDILHGYGVDERLDSDDLKRIPALLWLSACMNFHFVDQTLRLLAQSGDEAAMAIADHLASYTIRGERLLELADRF